MRTERRFLVALALLIALSDAAGVRMAWGARDLAWPDDGAIDAPKAAPHRRRAEQRRLQRLQQRGRRTDTQKTKVVAPTPKGRKSLHPADGDAAAEHARDKQQGAEGPRAGRADRPQVKPAGKDASEAADDDDDEDVESVETVEAVVPSGATGKEGAASADSGWTFNKLLGHLHAAMVHLPIAWLLAWAGCEVLATLWAHPFLQMAGLPIGLLTALSFAPSVLSGLLRLDELTQGSAEYDVGPALLHRNLNFVAWALVIIAVILRLCNLHLKRGVARVLYVGLIVIALGVVGYSAHQGGIMVYGEDFFPF